MDLIYSSSSFLFNYNPINIGLLFYNNNNNNLILPSKTDILKYNLIIINLDNVLINNTCCKINNSDIIIKKLNESNIPYLIVSNNCCKFPTSLRRDLKQINLGIKDNVPIVTNLLLLKKTLVDIINKNILPINKYNKISLKYPHIYNIGVIGNINQYTYLKSKLKKTKRSIFYWIEDDYIPTNLDYIIIGEVENNKQIENIEFKSLKWIINNPNSELIIMNTKVNNIILNNQVKYYTPISYLKNIENKFINFEFNKEQNKILKADLKRNNYGNINKFKITNNQLIIDNSKLDYYSDIFKLYNINYQEKSKILIIGNNIEYDLKLSKNLNCDYMLTLSGIINNINLDNNKNIKYVVPDISYLLL
tara:strand:- start:390 stop:1478 length:1089 start_codon:yes stop_codon:yes gene_type:complete